MAENQADGELRAIRLEYWFDRLLAEKLAQAYQTLVPEHRGLADRTPGHYQEALNDENGGNLRASFV